MRLQTCIILSGMRSLSKGKNKQEKYDDPIEKSEKVIINKAEQSSTRETHQMIM